MLLSHQAPVLPLKRWRPRSFSGLALCLGTIAPDLEFILRMDNDWVISHTLAGQVYFTIPLVLVLHLLLSRLALPFWLPRLPLGPPLHLEELQALDSPRDFGAWTRVAVSGFIGGVTHVLLDAVTHGNHSGWLVPYVPFLRTPVDLAGHLPLHDVLQIVLSLVLAPAACASWRGIARDRLLWHWRGGTPPPAVRLAPPRSRPALVFLMACAAVGFVVGVTSRPGAAPLAAYELGVFGSIAFGFYAFLVLPAVDRLLRAGERTPLARPAAAADEA
jgi:hypothetical protein